MHLSSPMGVIYQRYDFIGLGTPSLGSKRTYKTYLYQQNIGKHSLTYALGCIILVAYTQKHLPIIDFRPYKIGVNIQKGMEIPANAPQGSV